MGKLVPFEWYDCLPNDIARISCNATIKASPMIAPLMHRVNMLTQYYFVPYRIIWDSWQEFITGGEDGTAAPVYPTMKSGTGIEKNTLFDYFGLPIKRPNLEFSAMLARAYTKIWNDHYKIEDIETELPLSTQDGEDTITNKEIQKCHWARDKFTKAKPFTQRGAQISVPVVPSNEGASGYAVYKPTSYTIGNYQSTRPEGVEYFTAKIEAYDKEILSFNVNNFSINDTKGYIRLIIEKQGGERTGAQNQCPAKSTEVYLPITNVVFGEPKSYSNAPYVKGRYKVGTNFPSPRTCFENQSKVTWWWFDPDEWAEKTKGQSLTDIEFTINENYKNSGAINIIDLRVATQLQKYQERSLKYGAEYEDYCKQEFGVRPRDSRLQKSEYLGGSQGILQISEVLQTTDTTETPLGAQAGYGVGSIRQRRIRYRCPEHGIIIGIMSIRPETIYTDGIDRSLLKTQRFEYWTRELAGIGAQEIKEQELYATESNKDKVFGYDLKGNYQEYYSKQSRVSGSFRDDLSFWHLARIFNETPVLNKSFIEMNPRKDIFAITDQTLPAFQVYIQNSARFYRPIPRKIRTVL